MPIMHTPTQVPKHAVAGQKTMAQQQAELDGHVFRVYEINTYTQKTRAQQQAELDGHVRTVEYTE